MSSTTSLPLSPQPLPPRTANSRPPRLDLAPRNARVCQRGDDGRSTQFRDRLVCELPEGVHPDPKDRHVSHDFSLPWLACISSCTGGTLPAPRLSTAELPRHDVAPLGVAVETVHDQLDRHAAVQLREVAGRDPAEHAQPFGQVDHASAYGW